MSVRNTSYQQVHDLYELCSDGRSLQEFCRMSGGLYSMEEIQDALSVCSKEILRGDGCFVHTSLFQGEDK